MKANNRQVHTTLRFFGLAATAFLAIGWGATAHRFINTKAVYHLPSSMSVFFADSSFFGAHASDADDRKGSDTSESPKHFIDIENYPGYVNLSGNLDSLIALYGWGSVKSTGILPWATVWTYDSLVARLERGDTNGAKLTASDLGHYVADGQMPLHITTNYNGQLTGNTGIHSRYESSMINAESGRLSITPSRAIYVEDKFSFVMDYLIEAHSFVDSVLQADDSARAVSGWSGSGQPPAAYYTELWNRSGPFTLRLMQSATVNLASLWYSANIDAGTIPPVQLALFSATSLGSDGVTLAWSTLSEVHNRGFEVERSAERDSGYRAITPEIIPGAGTSMQPHDYSFNDSTAGGGIWYYRLEQVGLDGSVHSSNPVQVSVLNSVAQRSPARFELFQNYPNPFNPSTSIAGTIPPSLSGQRVTLQVFDIQGQPVITLLDGRNAGGMFVVRWDGQTASGEFAASGIYFFRLTAGSFIQTKEMILLR